MAPRLTFLRHTPALRPHAPRPLFPRLASAARPRPPPPPPFPAGPAPASYPPPYLSIALVFGSAFLGYVLHAALTPAAPFSPHLLDSATGAKLQAAAQPRYGTPADYAAAIAELKALFNVPGQADKVSTDASDLDTHGISDWSYHEAKRPTAVVWAESTAEVQQIVDVARRHRVPVTPFSGGTSLEGHFSSPYGGISIDVSLMDQIVRVSEDDGEAVVQPGVKWEDLNAHLASKDIPLFFPLDPGPGATIGGMAATGCSGTNAVRYGTAKAEWFLNLAADNFQTVVLPTGEVIKTRSSARKSSAGWDATKLFIGAEGTLGIVTEATVRLAPLLPTKVAVVTFPGVEEAVRAATEVVNKGFPVQCVEYLDGSTMHAINGGGFVAKKYAETDTLFFKFQGSDVSMKEVSRGVAELVKKHGGANFQFSKTDKEAADLWAARKAALWSVLALREGGKVWTTDVCVPIAKLPRLVRETREDFERRGLEACHFGHVGDGNVHSLALFSDDAELARVREAVHDMVERAIALGGTCTGEHGVGVGKVEYLTTELGEGTVNLMETVKRTIDPLNLFNPGKIYPHIQPVQ